MRSVKGFTLIELMLSIALLAIAVGVTTDIILTITKSYSKTQVTNEIEQNANFVLLKLSKELRNAVSVNVPGDGLSVVFTDKAGNTVTYCYTNQQLKRSSTTGSTPAACGASDGELLINTDPIGGVKVACNGASSKCFESLGNSPAVTKISLKFSQAGTPTGVQFTGSVDLNETIVSRGTY